ncbi:pyruvate dehydrogenase (acetyl-transferring) E1 component subunit alpha [Steroidobacter sp.]|uniref:pyruvate dehydrogenase (acetyl-transferring) E1 component subunit alpha n=1 Tax=Steroidobacter sp. TaxID=1978227 RepID=UPI001A373327|nr:pyruvate dehydrogenase (acetyl-transferring) E1 component subunit alpha [Steroidobacter sp.]MBL8270384.1 pyruvate dehydrogenase (acetyl-transferring) E1 component subunit alpha [Steroidobacter sp.]
MRTVAEFRIEYLRQVSPQGRALEELPAFAADNDELLKLFAAMLRARTFDTKAVNLQRTGKLGTYPSCLGQEAAHIGVGAAMRPEDSLAIVYREIGTLFWRGVSMTEVLLYWGGDERGNNFAVPRHDFPWCVPIATQTLHAAGAAMAFKIRKEPRCAVAYIGDGGTSEGSFYEAMNLAGARQLPIVFVVVNNKWAISVPIEQQTACETLAQKAIAAGIPGVQVDGNDVIAVRDCMSKALDKARTGGGPTVVEAISYRLSDHTTADDASRYRDEAEVTEAWKVEPMIRLRKLLESRGVLDEAREQAMKAQFTREVDAAVQEYLNTPRQSTDAMFDYLYANPPAYLEEQKELARRYAGTGRPSH